MQQRIVSPTKQFSGTPKRRRLAFRGNCVVPIHNPFHPPSPTTETGTERREDGARGSVLSLCPGLEIRLDHVLTVSADGFIEHFEHSSSQGSREVLASAARKETCESSRNKSGTDVSPVPSERIQPEYETVDIVNLSPSEFLCPGFIDTHIHAPQFSFAGTATDRPLMGRDGWLETYTFPAEMSLASDLKKAKDVYGAVVETTLNYGTTTAVYFATLHLEPTKTLVDVALERGQRSLVGKVCMDRNGPDCYLQSVEKNVRETEELIGYIHEVAGREKQEQEDTRDEGKDRAGSSHSYSALPEKLRRVVQQPRNPLPLVLPVVTLRFIPTCTPRLLSALGTVVAKYGCHVQSHISESIDEVEFSRHLDATIDGGDGRTDASILDSHDLLTDRCIMAHGVHLNDSDNELLRERGAAVAHCPLSNFFFAGGSLPTRRMLERGIRVGLGTDVAGGYSPSMMESARMACVASRSLQHAAVAEKQVVAEEVKKEKTETKDTDSGDGDSCGTNVIDYRHAFYIATLGGAEALGLSDRIGTFRVGMEFDAIILSADRTTQTGVHVFNEDNVQDIFQKLCNLGDDRNIRSVYVQGRLVKGIRVGL